MELRWPRIGGSAMRTLTDLDHAELWGRDRELALAEAFLDAIGQHARGFLLSGEPGIGKTAMWQAIMARARERGCRVLACRCEKAEARLSFVSLSDLMAGLGSHVLECLPDVQRRAFAAALLLDMPEDTGDPDPRTVATAFTSLIREWAGASRVLIAIDDIQWLDAPTARVLSFAMRRLVDNPIGWLCTSRTPSSSEDPLGLHRALGGCTRVHLPPLSAGALATLLIHRTEHTLTRPVLKRFVDASGGNPLFALEIANALTEPGDQLSDRVTIPASLRTLLSARIPKLQRGAREALLIAAAASHPTRALIERASSSTALAEAEETGLLEIQGERVRFRHPLYASAVYMSAATSRRHALHQRLAQLVADDEERARHLAMATRHPDSAVGLALERGAAAARARGAWESAAELLEQAQRLTPQEDAELRQRRAISAAEHHIHAGDRGRARELLEDVLSDPAERARVDALRLLAQISYHDENYVEAQRLYEDALRVATDPVLATTVELGLSYVHANRGDSGVSTEFAYRAQRRVEVLGDDALLADALATSAMTDFLCGRGVHWPKVQDALRLEDRARLVPLHHRPSTIAATLTFYVGQLAEARQQLLELESWARDRGDESDVAWVDTTLSWLETLSGNFPTRA
jgi:predicted ATPase